jgi:triacylglycerol esterase/lipase EstA (alpha/beta hydrolase family)
MNLVFASGFLVPQQLPAIDYFRGLEAHLAGKHRALFPDVPPVGSSEDRAGRLADAIEQEFPTGQVHIIAHSMGGLDSRTLIGRNLNGLAVPGRIASLTTLSTPHRGSPVADLLAGPRPNDARRIWYDRITQIVRDLGLVTGALGDLTTTGAARIPDAAQTHPHIRYRSYFATGRAGSRPTSFALLATHIFIETVTGQPNDGLVTLDSAKYGEFQQSFWQGDHADIVGHNLDNPLPEAAKFDHLAAYDAIIAQL